MNNNALLQSRRSFIKAAGAAAAAGSIAALAPARAKANDAATSIDEIEWDEEAELVVAGGGLAGFVSAVAAVADCGATKVILFEKGETPGGCSPFSVCRFTYTTEEHREDFVTYMKGLEQGRQTVSDDVYEAYAQGSIEAIDWVKSLGANPDEMVIEEPGQQSPTQPSIYPEYPELPGSDSIGNFQVGQAEGATGPTSLYLFMQQYADEHSDAIDVRYSSPVTALVQDPATRRVVGVVAECDGKSIYVRADKGVVMCTGGFENDQEMIQNYLGYEELISIGARLNTGDGFRMCSRAGAAMWHLRGISGPMLQYKRESDGVRFSVRTNSGIQVGANGRRYMRDAGGKPAPTELMAGPVTAGENGRHGLINVGGEFITPMIPPTWLIVDATGYADEKFVGKGMFSAVEYEGDMVENGDALMGQTLTELAEAIGLPEGALEETVEEWNTMVDAGVDYAFHRNPDTFVKIETAPFYAVRLKPGFLNTDGGPKRSAKAEVVDVDGEPIPGLYAAGELGSVTAACYQGGQNISESGVFGRIAAHSAFGIE